MSQSENGLSFNKGYTENGFAELVFHLHLRYMGDNNELYFRDYLIEYPKIAKEYEELKLRLWKEYEHNRDGYTNAKTEFVIIPVRRSRLSGEAGASIPEGESHQKSYAAKGSLHEQAYDRLPCRWQTSRRRCACLFAKNSYAVEAHVKSTVE